MKIANVANNMNKVAGAFHSYGCENVPERLTPLVEKVAKAAKYAKPVMQIADESAIRDGEYAVAIISDNVLLVTAPELLPGIQQKYQEKAEKKAAEKARAEAETHDRAVKANERKLEMRGVAINEEIHNFLDGLPTRDSFYDFSGSRAFVLQKYAHTKDKLYKEPERVRLYGDTSQEIFGFSVDNRGFLKFTIFVSSIDATAENLARLQKTGEEAQADYEKAKTDAEKKGKVFSGKLADTFDRPVPVEILEGILQELPDNQPVIPYGHVFSKNERFLFAETLVKDLRGYEGNHIKILLQDGGTVVSVVYRIGKESETHLLPSGFDDEKPAAYWTRGIYGERVIHVYLPN